METREERPVMRPYVDSRKERLFLWAAFPAAALAGWGALDLGRLIFGAREGSFTPFLGLVVFFAVLALILGGHDAIRELRVRDHFSNRDSLNP